MLPLVSGELAGALPREDPGTPSPPIGQNNKQQSKLPLRGTAGSKAGTDHGSLHHPVPHSLHWPPAPLGLPCLPGLPPSWTLTSALPGKRLANGSEGPPQVIAGGEMERAGGGGGKRRWVDGKQLRQQGSWGSSSGVTSQAPLGTVFFQP